MDNSRMLEKVCRSAYVPLVRMDNFTNQLENKAPSLPVLSDEVCNQVYVSLTRLKNLTSPRQASVKGDLLAEKENTHAKIPRVSLKRLSEAQQKAGQGIVRVTDLLSCQAYVPLKRLKKLRDPGKNKKKDVLIKDRIQSEAYVSLKRLVNLSDDQKVSAAVSDTTQNDALCPEPYVRLVRLAN